MPDANNSRLKYSDFRAKNLTKQAQQQLTELQQLSCQMPTTAD
jgi:hypothetical protein